MHRGVDDYYEGEHISVHVAYNRINHIDDDGNVVVRRVRPVYFPNLISASANSSRPRQELISLKGSGSRERALTQGQDIREYLLQSLCQVA